MSLFNKRIRHVAIIHRSFSPPAEKKAGEIKEFLRGKNISATIVSQKVAGTARNSKGDLIIALGGDGAYLKAVHFGKKKNIPVLGVNMGSLGFLTPHSSADIFSVLKKTLSGKMFFKTNCFISAVLHQQPLQKDRSGKKGPVSFPDMKKAGRPHKVFQAVNDIVIERGALSHLISISVHVNSRYIYSVKADGLITASPLGSTAYNLAAGGPILHPSAQSFVITPICSHSLTVRPLIIHDKSRIHLRVREKKAFLTIDGITKQTLQPRHILSIQKDTGSFVSLTEKKETEFPLLREKLKFGQRD